MILLFALAALLFKHKARTGAERALFDLGDGAGACCGIPPPMAEIAVASAASRFDISCCMCSKNRVPWTSGVTSPSRGSYIAGELFPMLGTEAADCRTHLSLEDLIASAAAARLSALSGANWFSILPSNELLWP